MHAIHKSALPVRPGTIPVAIYTRVSTTDQVGGRFDSCESQEALCREHVARHAQDGWYINAVFSDPAYSGGSMKRPGMQALMRHIEQGQVKVVLIFKFERVLRSTDDWVPFRAFLKKHGCRLESPTENLAPETAYVAIDPNQAQAILDLLDLTAGFRGQAHAAGLLDPLFSISAGIGERIPDFRLVRIPFADDEVSDERPGVLLPDEFSPDNVPEGDECRVECHRIELSPDRVRFTALAKRGSLRFTTADLDVKLLHAIALDREIPLPMARLKPTATDALQQE